MTSYIMSLDDRVACAAPACYLTTWRRLIDTIGPQDSEQNIFGQVGFGLDHPDYVMMRAPRPTLILSSTRDFFDIEGTWDNFRQSKRFYARFGYAERVNLVEVDAKHGVTKTSRIAMVRWMRRWLLSKDNDVVEKEPKLWSEAELRCTPDGEVLRLPGERRQKRLTAMRNKFWSGASDKEKRAKIREIAGIAPLDKIPQRKVNISATIKKKSHQMMKLSIETANGIKVPALLFVPVRANGKLTLLASGKGKASTISRVEKLMERGRTVLTVDVRGIGETASAGRANTLLGSDWKEFYLAYVLGRSMVGMRAEDILASARYLSVFSEAEPTRPVELIADGKAAVAALHAAALEPRTFSSVSIGDAAQAWDKILGGNEPQDQFVNTVHNALRWYDLTKLQTLAKPQP